MSDGIFRSPRRGGSLPWLIAVALTAGACGDGGSSSWQGSVVDSAGVAVVSNPATGLWSPDERWTVEPELSIGVTDGDPEYQFGQIVGIDIDSDGRVYVADLQAREIRAFAADGRWLSTIGSPGTGPGELGMAIAGPFLIGDEVRVADLMNQRISRFSTEGEILGSVRFDLTSGVPVRWDETGEDQLVAQLRAMGPVTPNAAPSGDPVVSYSEEGAVTDTLLVLPPGQSLQLRGGQMRMRIFDSEPMWDLGEDGRLVSGRNSEYRIEVRDAGGVLRQVVTRPFEKRPVTERDQQVILDAISEAARSQGVPAQSLEAALRQFTFADYYPAFASLFAGPEGSLWVQRIRTGTELAGEEGTFDAQDLGSSEWDVFDDDGRYMGVVDFPVRFGPVRLEGDRFYGIARDELGVQSVGVYRLIH